MLKIKMFPVRSTNVSKMGYDSKNKILRVEFTKGGTYDYLQVPEKVYNLLKMSESIGTSLRFMIKGTYSYRKVKEFNNEKID